MRRLDYLKMNTALWKNIGTEHHYNLSGWLNAAAGLEENLRELDGELSEFGGIGFVSQDEHTDKIIEILTVLSDCRLWLDKDIEDYVDRPLKEIFNALDDQLASIDARKIKTPNLAGDKIAVKYDECGMPYEEGTPVAPPMLTLEDFTGSSNGKSQGFLVYEQKIAGFTDIMEERYNYTVTDAESEISYKDYTQWYEPSESYFKKDVSFWTRMAQAAWSATGIGDFVDAALGYELITGDMNTLEESNRKAEEGMLETALLCLPGVMNAGGGGKAVLCAVGKELGENMVMDTMYEAMEAGGCSEARNILNAVLIFRTVYSFVDAANSAVNARRFRDAYKDKDWTDWVKRAEGTGKNSDVPGYPKGVVWENGNSKTIFNSTPELQVHIKNIDPSVPRKRGIGGAHNSAEFFKNDVEIISEIPSKIPGVKVVEYKMPKLNADGTPTGEYGARIFKKTIYDPEVISDDEFIKRGLEAANDAISKSDDGVMPREWSGVDSEGITWHGYFEDGEITSFFPDE